MPQRIDVPGMGVVEFPDGMSDEQITAAIQQSMPKQSAMEKLTGTNGPRYQTWPERAARGIFGGLMSAGTLPGDVYTGKTPIYLPTLSDDPERADYAGNAGPSGKVFNPEVIGRALELGTIAAPVNPAVRAGDKAIPGAKRALSAERVKVPTTEELAAAGVRDIKAAKDSGLRLSPNSMAEYSRKVQQQLIDDGILPVDAANTFAKLKELENAPADSFVTPSGLHSLRKSLQTTAQNFNPNAARDQLAASRAIKALDGIFENVNPKDVLAGTPSATGETFKRGFGNFAAAQRSNDLTGVLDRANTGLLERAETRAAASNSGRNLDNTLRGRVASLLEKPKEVSGFNDPELAALNQFVQGTPGRNSARNIANFLGGGGGLGQLAPTSVGAAVGATAAGPVGAAVGAAVPLAGGVSAKYIENLLAKKGIKNIDEMLRMRSPLFEERLATPNLRVVSPEARASIVRALLLDQQ